MANISFSKAQALFTKEGAIYKIYSDIDLTGGGEDGYVLNIPAHSTIQFYGGMIKGGTIVLNNTLIECPICIESKITGRICGTFRVGQTFYNKKTGKTEIWDGNKWMNTDGTEVEVVRYPPCSAGGEGYLYTSPESLEFIHSGGTEVVNIISNMEWSID